VGKPRLCFNAHRIHSPQQIIEYLSNLELVELSGIDDRGRLARAKKNLQDVEGVILVGSVTRIFWNLIYEGIVRKAFDISPKNDFVLDVGQAVI